MKPLSSDRSWDEDSLTDLSWNNLLNSPLDPGQSITIKINFKVMDATNIKVSNTAKVIGAKNENGQELLPKTAKRNTKDHGPMSSFGPVIGCAGCQSPFPPHSGLKAINGLP